MKKNKKDGGDGQRRSRNARTDALMEHVHRSDRYRLENVVTAVTAAMAATQRRPQRPGLKASEP